MSKFIYGMAKFTDYHYGYGSKNIQNERIGIDILEFVYDYLGIKKFEISSRYKSSEKILSSFLNKNNLKANIHYKIDNLELENFNYEVTYSDICKTLEKLKINSFDVVYLHQNEYKIISNKKIINFLSKLNNKKITKNLGGSIYSMKEFEYLRNNEIYNYIQLPINISNTYFYNKLKNKDNNKIVARSIFLQGTLFNKKIQNHIYKYEINNFIREFNKKYVNANLSYIDVLSCFVSNLNKVDYILIGSVNKKNLNSIIKKSKIKLKREMVNDILKFSSVNKKWKNPRNWFK